MGFLMLVPSAQWYSYLQNIEITNITFWKCLWIPSRFTLIHHRHNLIYNKILCLIWQIIFSPPRIWILWTRYRILAGKTSTDNLVSLATVGQTTDGGSTVGILQVCGLLKLNEILTVTLGLWLCLIKKVNCDQSNFVPLGISLPHDLSSPDRPKWVKQSLYVSFMRLLTCRPKDRNLLRTSRHDWTAFLCAKVCDGPIQHVDLVEEIHSWKRCKKNMFTSSIHETKYHVCQHK